MYIYIFFRKWLLWSFGAVERKNPMVISLSQMMSHLHQAFAPSAESLSMPAGTLFAGATPGHQSFVRYQFGRWSLKRSEKMESGRWKTEYRDLLAYLSKWNCMNCTELQWFLACAGSEDRVTESRIPRRMLMPKEPWDPGVRWVGFSIGQNQGVGESDQERDEEILTFFFLGKESFPINNS